MVTRFYLNKEFNFISVTGQKLFADTVVYSISSKLTSTVTLDKYDVAETDVGLSLVIAMSLTFPR